VRLQQGSRSGIVNAVPRWRVAAGAGILAGLALLLAMLAPAYFHNLDLQNYVSGLTRGDAAQPVSDTDLRQRIVEKARQLDVPVSADNVRITRAADGKLEHIDVRYFVDVNLPGYAVKLHFYPGAASQ
jgi:hypothetical protein